MPLDSIQAVFKSTENGQKLREDLGSAAAEGNRGAMIKYAYIVIFNCSVRCTLWISLWHKKRMFS